LQNLFVLVYFGAAQSRYKTLRSLLLHSVTEGAVV